MGALVPEVRRVVRVLAAGLALALVFESATLHAEPTAEDRETANALMDRADLLVEQGKHSDALELYRQAHALIGVPTTGIEVARTLAKLGRLIEARRLATEVQAMPVAPDEREPFAQARRDARALVSELDARIPRLTVSAAGADRVRIDASEIAGFERERTFDLDPGSHTIVVTTGQSSQTSSINLVEGDRKRLSFDPEPRPPATEAKRPARRLPPARPTESDTSTLRTVGVIGIGVGAAGLIFGATTGIMALQKKSDLDDGGCSEGRCPASQAETVDDYNTLRTLSSAGLIGGAVLAAAGAVLIGFSGGGSERERAKWQPSLSNNTGGARFAF